MRHITAVILNFNSEKDLPICAEQIAVQKGIRLSIVIVDNASQEKSVQAISAWLKKWRSNAIVGNAYEIESWIKSNEILACAGGLVYFVLNKSNSGYSAGNNIGAKLADLMKADAVLIANPDMRFESLDYLQRMSEWLFTNNQNCIAASRILGLDGKDQNPLREPRFLEELFWFRHHLFPIPKPTYVLNPVEIYSDEVPKVSGCCFLAKTDCLKRINFLDENVFLFCEEPILSSKIRKINGRIIYCPEAIAIHAHVKGEKGSLSKRMLHFIKSRKYYLKNYSSYNPAQLFLLFVSYDLLSFFYLLKKE